MNDYDVPEILIAPGRWTEVHSLTFDSLKLQMTRKLTVRTGVALASRCAIRHILSEGPFPRFEIPVSGADSIEGRAGESMQGSL